MIAALAGLSTEVLEALALALERGTLPLPSTGAAVEHLVPRGAAATVAEALSALGSGGPTERVAAVLRLLVADRVRAAAAVPRVELVWSGPEALESLNRDTGVVVRELLERARRSVLIATYALDEGTKARAIFGSLAARLDRGDSLDVRLFVHVPPDPHPARPAAEVLASFLDRFRTRVWPGTRLPALFYDPRTLDGSGSTRASLHAKCVVIDESTAFVTSANFTEAAQRRNVEVGLVVEGPDVARALVAQFASLVGEGVLRELC